MAVGVALLGRLSTQKMHQEKHHGIVKHVQKVNRSYKCLVIVRRKQWGRQFSIDLSFFLHICVFSFALFCLKVHFLQSIKYV